MPKLRVTAGFATAAILAAGGSAQAATVFVTYRGVVASGTDASGEFGASAPSLAGKSFTATLRLDDTRGVSFYDPPIGSGFEFNRFQVAPDQLRIRIGGVGFDFKEEACGGSEFCTLAHSVVAAPFSGISTFYDRADAYPFGEFDEFLREEYEGLSLGLSSTANPFVADFDYDTPLFHAFSPGDVSSGELRIFYRTSDPLGADVIDKQVSATLVPLSVRVSVPEPATWALMILGFGAAGAVLRRRRAGLSATPA